MRPFKPSLHDIDNAMEPIAFISVVFALIILTTPLSAQPFSSTNQPTSSSTNQPTRGPHNQTITIKGVSYATGVKLGMPIPALIRAKALAQKKRATSEKPKNT